MKDVSVLLNLTGKLVFEKTNPLMDLVSGHGPYLYYDRLSLERFPLDQEEQEGHVQKLLINLRNLLGSRRLSAEDQGGDIRIIVTIDLVGGFAHQADQDLCFPAQKASQFKEKVDEFFKNEPQLLSRFRYTFIFMEWDSDEPQTARFYHSLAYDGCFGQSSTWITSEMLSVNVARDQMLTNLKSPSIDLSLDDSSIRYQYSVFQQKLNMQKARISELLAKANTAKPFNDNVSDACSKIKTIGDLSKFNYDSMLRSTVGELIGLCSSKLNNSHCFIFKMRTGTLTERKKDEMVFNSLLQLLGTMEGKWISKLSIVDGSMNEHSLNTDAMTQLKREVTSYLTKLKEGGELRMTPADIVKYKVFSQRNAKSTETNVHHDHNVEVDEHRIRLYDEFHDLRRVPFFFDNWQWYTNVSNILDRIYAYENEHDHPRYSSPGRITEKEMKCDYDNKSYADLEIIKKEIESSLTGRTTAPEANKSGNLLTDLKTYLERREKIMANFAEYKEELKKEMVKLGFASITYRICIVVCLILTLCYAFHYFFTGDSSGSIWIGVCFGAVALICAIAAIISQYRIKYAIKTIFIKIINCFDQMNEQKKWYFGNINKRVSEQNDADIKRKNLEEIISKLNLFKFHNMQVELWEKHYSSLEEKLSDMINYSGLSANEHPRKDDASSIKSLQIEEMPCLPEDVCRKFQTMTISLSSGQKYENITCFLNSLNVTNINNE